MQQTKENIISETNLFESTELDRFDPYYLFDGKNIFLDIEGSSKSTKMMQACVNKITKEKDNKNYWISSNTIEESSVKYKHILKLLQGDNSNLIKLDSYLEMLRLLFSEFSFYNRLRKCKNDSSRIYFISCFEGSYHILKEKSSYKNDNDYKYSENNPTNIVKCIKQIKTRFDYKYIKKIEHDYLCIVLYDDNKIDNIQLEEFLKSCCSNNNEINKYIKTKHKKQRVIHNILKNKHILKKLLRGKGDFKIFTKQDIFNINSVIKDNKKLEKDLLNNKIHNKIICVQNEKLFSLFNNNYEKINNEFKDNNILCVDEIPVGFHMCNNIDKIVEFGEAIQKDKRLRNIEEYGMCKIINDKEDKEIKANNNQTTTSIPIIIDYFNNDVITYLKPMPMFRFNKFKINPIFDVFENICLLTTEKMPCLYFKTKGFEVYENVENIDKFKYDTKNITVNVYKNNLTVKNNEDKVKEIIERTKTDEIFHIGKKSLNANSTVEAIKGNNKLYQDEKLKKIVLWMNPMNPNEIAPYYMNISKCINSNNLFNELAIHYRSDCINQVVGRVKGFREIYRRKLFELEDEPVNDVEVEINISQCDTISLKALEHSRYMNGITMNII